MWVNFECSGEGSFAVLENGQIWNVGKWESGQINCYKWDPVWNVGKCPKLECWGGARFGMFGMKFGIAERGGTWSWYHGGRRPSSDNSFHSPTIIPPSALDKPSIMKRCHHRQMKREGVTARSPTMATLHDTRFVECRLWNDGWTVKTVVTWSSASMIPAPGLSWSEHIWNAMDWVQ